MRPVLDVEFVPAVLSNRSFEAAAAECSDFVTIGLFRDEGVDLRGYFAWCLLDTFEWAWGFEVQFGLVRADMRTGERTPKNSFYAYRNLISQYYGKP